jgi:hypothetical protein
VCIFGDIRTEGEMSVGKEYDIFMANMGKQHYMVYNDRPNVQTVAVHDCTALILLQSSKLERDGNSINVIYYGIHYLLLAHLYITLYKIINK